MPEPTEVQRETGNRPNGHIKVGDLDVTIETAMGAEKNSRFIFSYARKNEAQRTGLSILWDGQPLASDCRPIMLGSLLFEHYAVQVSHWLARSNQAQAIHGRDTAVDFSLATFEDSRIAFTALGRSR